MTALVVTCNAANAQLVSSWSAPATDDGTPVSDFVSSWLTDTNTGDFADLPNLFSTRALAADNARGRIYTAGDVLITFVVDPNSNPDSIAELDERIPIRDAAGETIGRPSAMGFADGLIYAFTPAGFFAIDPETGFAAPLPGPIGTQNFAGIDYNPDDGLMYAVTGSFPNEEIVAFDLDTFTVMPVAVVPESVYNFANGFYRFDGVAVGEGKVFLTTGIKDLSGSLNIGVYDITAGEFDTLPNPPRDSENRFYPGGATYFTGLLSDGEVDTDGDGVNDSKDNCLAQPNPDQRDSNADGFGNACDADLNDDNVVNVADLGILRSVFFTADADADFNGDGIVNVADLARMRAGFFAPPGPSAIAP